MKRGVFEDLTGQRFWRLLVIGFARRTPRREFFWSCLCQCGKLVTVSRNHLHNGHTKSCGCLRVDITTQKNRVHGMRGTPTYVSWRRMKARCLYTGSHAYHRYGGRGIKVCERWRKSFVAFLADMGERPAGKTIDRINTNGNYEIGNCRWATPKEQRENQTKVTL
jgi:hypothetical protein